MSKEPEDIIFLYMCTINEDHIMYGSWDKKARQSELFVILSNFFALWPS